ncbi:MAG: hypothetical protein M3433_04290, partial [Actinomycetota bacterium]|nr:hypothetical protein [Actinomycetota bacterium]
MNRMFKGRSVVVVVTALAALATGADLASAGPVEDTVKRVDGVVQGVKGKLDQTTSRVLPQPQARPQAQRQAGAVRPRGATPSSPGGYQPPLHGTNPHGQGTVGTVDLAPTGQRPLSGDPSGNQPQPQDDEEIVVGRARGEKDAQGYHGHITVAALFGNEIVGVDTRPGQTEAGPLDAVQQGLLTPVCNGTANQICLELVTADSTTTSSSTTNRFRAARAQLGGPTGITTGVAESTGTAEEDANCQRTSGSANVVNAQVGSIVGADAATATSSSSSCRAGSGGTSHQTESGRVIGINNAGVPITAPGCGNGTADTVTTIPLLLTFVCNATDTNGVNETVAQAAQRYGVREALSVFAVNVPGVSLAKLTTSAAESRSEAPAGPGGPPPDGGGPD